MFYNRPLSNIQLISVNLTMFTQPRRWNLSFLVYISGPSADDQNCSTVCLSLHTSSQQKHKFSPIKKMEMVWLSLSYSIPIKHKEAVVAIIMHICSFDTCTETTVHFSNKNTQQWKVREGIFLLHVSKLVYLQQQSCLPTHSRLHKWFQCFSPLSVLVDNAQVKELEMYVFSKWPLHLTFNNTMYTTHSPLRILFMSHYFVSMIQDRC